RFADVTTPGDCPQNSSVTRTWTATDHCGNNSTKSQAISVVDTTAPVISTVPGPSTIQCPAPPQFATPTATDACDPNPTLTFADMTTPGNCPQNHSVRRTWTATDHCGNSSTKSQTITVRDTTPPVISGCPGSTNTCGQPTIVLPTANDTCQGSIPVNCTRSDNKPLSDPYPIGTTTVTCTASDACGNAATPCTFTVTISDSV